MRFVTAVLLVVCLGGPVVVAQRPRFQPGNRDRVQAIEAPTETPSNPEEYGKVGGVVYDARTGAPLSKARVTMFQVDREGRQRLAATTDTGGKFIIENVEPGRYRLMASRNRYANAQYGERSPGTAGTTVTVVAKQHLKDLAIALLPAAVVTGRVVDEDGEPVPYAQVNVLKYRYIRGKRELVPAGGGVNMTNDLGEYRLFGIAPGKYYVSVSYRDRGFAGGGAGPDDEEDSTYPSLYYPGVLDPGQTQPIVLRAGEERSGMDFRLTRARAVRIRGTVSAEGGPLPGEVFVSLAPRNGGFRGFGGRRFDSVDTRTGEFELKGLLPGSYVVTAMTRGREARLFARYPVEVGNSDVDGVNLVLGPGLQINGKLRFESDPPTGTTLEDVRVMLRPKETMFGGGGERAGEDGSFSIDGLAPSKYTVSVSGLPPDGYLKEAAYGDQDVLASGLDLEQGGGASLALVVSLKGGRVDGTVKDKDGKPSPGATVALVPEESRRDREDLYRSATTDQYGQFTLRGIAPGEYKLFAFEDIEPGAYQDAAFLESYEDNGEKIELDAGGAQAVELKVIVVTG